MDLRLGADLYESFVNYQTLLMTEYNKIVNQVAREARDAK